MKVCFGCGARFNQVDWRCDVCGAQVVTSNGILSFAPELAQKYEGFKPEFFAQLAQLEKQNFWFCARNELIVWAMTKYFPQSETFLEIGCGTGFVLAGLREIFPKLSIAGSEIYAEGLRFAACRVPDAFFFQMDARQIPYESEFDVIGAFDVIEHIDEDEAVLEQMHQAVRLGGGIILTVPQHRFLWSKQDEFACHVRRYSRDELVNKVRRAGFEVTAVTSFVSLLLPLMMASRCLKKSRMPKDLAEELRLSRLANGLLGVIMGVERRMIQTGARFPAGGSLLLIARKAENEAL